VGIWTISALIFWQVETAFLSTDDQNYYVTSDFDNCIIVFVDLLWVTFLPLHASFNQPHLPGTNTTAYVPAKKSISPRVSSRSYDSSSLDLVLENPIGYKDFCGFLAKEWSTENLLFWKQVNEYKLLADPEERTKKAQEIIETFIRDNAIYEVNLPDTIRTRIRKDIEQVVESGHAPVEMFDAAQTEIFSLMSNDSFHRFLKMEESFVELSENQASDLSAHPENGSRSNNRSSKDGATVSYGSPEKETSNTPSRRHTSVVSSQDIELELEPLDKNVKEEIPDENHQVFVL